MQAVILLLVALALLVVGAEYFTNAVEWLGRSLKLSDSATGSVLAAVGTAMPETLVPIVAIFFTQGAAGAAVGVGGILGAPFMISTLAMLVVAVALLAFRNRRRSSSLQFNPQTAENDLKFFLLAYGLAFAAALIPPSLGALKRVIGLALIPLYGIYTMRLLRLPASDSEEELSPLRVIGHIPQRFLPFEDWAARPGLVPILFQLAIAFAFIIGGAHLFVHEVEAIALSTGIEPLVLSLLITPIATELPEKLNSVVWIRQRKDTLAFGNMSGALVFQSAFPVTVGILFTNWSLSLIPGDPDFLPAMSCVLALLSGLFLLYFVRRHETLQARHLIVSGSLYFLFIGIVALTLLTGAPVATPAH